MANHDPAREARKVVLENLFKSQLEEYWPRVEAKLKRCVAISDLTLDEVKRVAYKAFGDFAGDKLDV